MHSRQQRYIAFVHRERCFNGAHADLPHRGTEAAAGAAGGGDRQATKRDDREAIDGYFAQEEPKGWREAFDAVRGMWAERDDLDELYADLRAGVERRLDRAFGRRRPNESGALLLDTCIPWTTCGTTPRQWRS